GRVLADAHDFLEGPLVLGLTATPPDRGGRRNEDIERYDNFFGPIDFEVPVPAVVKDGFLAPYQDLAYFVRPQAEELSFIANTDRSFRELMGELCGPRDKPATEVEDVSETPQAPRTAPLLDWLQHVLAERRLPTGVAPDWADFQRRDPSLSDAGPRCLLRRGIPLPEGVPEPPDMLGAEEIPEIEILVPVLDRYIRHGLRRSGNPEDHALAERAIQRLRLLGVQISETGSRACASPVGRVMAYSKAKAEALPPILRAEQQALGERIRAVVVADYEKTSAVTAEVSHLLDAEAGGAVAAFQTLVGDEETDALDPVLVTGSSVLVDDDLAPTLLARARQWLDQRGYDVQLRFDEEDGFHVLNGQGADWCPRVYVHLLTDLFQEGVTRCLVGTRGLLGEGWDASKINVLVDLTTVTTSMSVNQLRGRSIRLDPDDPQKAANNWDVVCVAPEFAKGLDDYDRFRRKHETIFGVTDDGAIEKGVGHVHAAFTSLQPDELEHSVAALNHDMLHRAALRREVRVLWRIGEPYHPEPVRTLEMKLPVIPRGFPPFGRSREPWSDRSLTLAIGEAILGALLEADLLSKPRSVQLTERAGGYLRLFLEHASHEDSAMFTESLREAMGPLHRPRYVIPRHIDRVDDIWLSRLLPAVVGRYFQRRHRRLVMLHAVPTPLARNKDLAAIYEQHWNRHVSPGQAMYAYRGEGEQLLRDAQRQKLGPQGTIHEKEVFL
ncbi:MAG: DEAD/DEAH box helicase, partial [Planctomycetes bacterium]|nr:DEAD/DEAH box helicase [Planctomycetota bacterium]